MVILRIDMLFRNFDIDMLFKNIQINKHLKAFEL